jgi:hypothetical protein
MAKSQMGSIESIEYLVNYGADINHLDNSGKCVLYYACKSGHMSICEFLIRKGANLYQDTENIFSHVNEKSQYLFCSYLIRNFYNLFQSQEALALPDKIVKSIDNNDIHLNDYLGAFKLIYENEDKVAKSKELRDDRILEYFASFDFREKFVTDISINLKDKIELLNIGKIKIEAYFPQIKRHMMNEFNLRVRNTENNKSIISVDSFMEKFREHKKLHEEIFKNANEQASQSKEFNLSFSELEDLLLNDNLINAINEATDECAKLTKGFLLCKKINYYTQEMERNFDVSNELFEFLSQEEVRSFLNRKK